MAKKKAAVKKVNTQAGLKKKLSKKATKTKKKRTNKQKRFNDKKFPNDANVWVDIESPNPPTNNGDKLEILVNVTARGPRSKSFCDFGYQAEYEDSNGVYWRSTEVVAVSPKDIKSGVLKFTLEKVRGAGSGILVGEELVVTILTTKSTKPNLQA